MSLPLLLERSKSGSGPQVPIMDAYDVLVVEGLAEGCSAHVELGTAILVIAQNGRFSIEPKTEKGTVGQARLDGFGSKAHIWLEKSNG